MASGQEVHMGVSYAVGLPNVGEFGDPRTLLELAVAAEESGWDGVFVWDHVLYHEPDWPVANSVVALSAIAARTRRIRLAPLMTALPRRRVQVVAREIATLDVLSGGRMIFGAGLGSMDREYAAFGENASLRARARRLDASLSVLADLWAGDAVSRGEPVPVEQVSMRPTPVQRPRPPIWCAGRWPATAGFRRAAAWDGVMPIHTDYGRGTIMPASTLGEIRDLIATRRNGMQGFDIALEGRTEPATATETIAPYVRGGLTWWVEAMGWWRGGVREAWSRILAGPPDSP
ncbi:LLM class flavin-dependent oxidoreductase [Actinocatenispora sera]|nr:LLM class flavin-dependent oxidoreductase [Actinocatenispora sera]